MACNPNIKLTTIKTDMMKTELSMKVDPKRKIKVFLKSHLRQSNFLMK